MSRNNLYLDAIRPFLITLRRYGFKRVGSVVQWAFRSWKHLLVTVVALCLGVVGIQQMIQLAKPDNDRTSAAATQVDQDEDKGLIFREVEAQPLGAEESSSAAPSASAGPDMGGNDQAVDPGAGSAPSHEQQSVADPQQPDPDREDAEDTAKALATAYLSRDEGDKWQEWVAQLTNDDLADYLADAKAPIDERGATEVTEVTVSDEAFDGAPKDTPLRWSREVEATVKTETGGTLKVRFDATLMLDEDEQWEATDFAQTTWNAEV